MAVKRLSVAEKMTLLEKAKAMGVSAACEEAGVSRPTYYKWLGRFVAEGEVGLKARSSAPRTRLRKSIANNRIHASEFTNLFPDESARQISKRMREAGHFVSASTVLRNRNRNWGKPKPGQEWMLKLSERFFRKEKITPSQLRTLNAYLPTFFSRGWSAKRIGDHVVQDVFPVDASFRFNTFHIHIAIDARSKWLFGGLYQTATGRSGRVVLEEAIAYIEQMGRVVKAVSCPNNRSFRSMDKGGYGEVLAHRGIQHASSIATLWPNPYLAEVAGLFNQALRARTKAHPSIREEALREWAKTWFTENRDIYYRRKNSWPDLVASPLWDKPRAVVVDDMRSLRESALRTMKLRGAATPVLPR